MLATFVVALREGVEASLIVGIIAAFLVRQQRIDQLRMMWLGVGLAVIVCIGAGTLAGLLDSSLPRAAQELFEAVAALVAAAAITAMIIWMKRHGRNLRGELESAAGRALDDNSSRALIAAAFLAVLREGLETVAFVIAVFSHATDAAAARTGVVAGLAVAACIGYAVYRGGARIHLGKFFQITSGILLLVCAGLCTSAVHSLHEAGVIAFGQTVAADFSGVLGASSVGGALLQAMFGITARPTVIELSVWVAYALPAALFLFAPRRNVRPVKLERA